MTNPSPTTAPPDVLARALSRAANAERDPAVRAWLAALARDTEPAACPAPTAPTTNKPTRMPARPKSRRLRTIH